MGFIKWMWVQYQAYKLNKIFKKDETLFLRSFQTCVEDGFTESQLLHLMNLFSSMGN